MKKYLSMFIVFTAVSTAYCETKPLMPVQAYMFYRLGKESDGQNGPALIRYRLPSEDEKRRYLYSDYVRDFSNGGSGDQITRIDIGRLCRWLIEDAPQENIPCVAGFIADKNREAEKIQAECLAALKEKQQQIGEAVWALGEELGVGAMPYYMDYLKSDSEALYANACSGISELFKSKAVQDEMKKRWVRDLVIFLWDNPNAQCRKELVRTLLLLDERDEAPMNIKDWVSICAAETDITVFERVHYLYPKEFREWEKKEGGFRPLVWE